MATEDRRQRLLLVDDTPMNLKILVQILHKEYQLGVVTSGPKALAHVCEHPPDLILLDIMMPDIDGYEVCTRLKAEQSTRDIPVIFVTALDKLDEKTRAFDLGAVDYITKPFQAAEVKARVRTHLQIVAYRRELLEKNEILRRNQEKLKSQVRQLQGIDCLIQLQMTAESLDQAGDEIIKIIVEVLGASWGAVYWLESGQQLKQLSSLGKTHLAPIIAGDDTASPVALAYKQAALQDGPDAVAVPLLYDQTPLGVLWVGGIESGAANGRPNALRRLAAETALVLHAAHLNEKLADGQVQMDQLLDIAGGEA